MSAHVLLLISVISLNGATKQNGTKLNSVVAPIGVANSGEEVAHPDAKSKEAVGAEIDDELAAEENENTINAAFFSGD